MLVNNVLQRIRTCGSVHGNMYIKMSVYWHCILTNSHGHSEGAGKLVISIPNQQSLSFDRDNLQKKWLEPRDQNYIRPELQRHKILLGHKGIDNTAFKLQVVLTVLHMLHNLSIFSTKVQKQNDPKSNLKQNSTFSKTFTFILFPAASDKMPI